MTNTLNLNNFIYKYLDYKEATKEFKVGKTYIYIYNINYLPAVKTGIIVGDYCLTKLKLIGLTDNVYTFYNYFDKENLKSVPINFCRYINEYYIEM